jgi:predicted ATPase
VEDAGQSFVFPFFESIKAVETAVNIQKSLAEQPILADGQPLAVRIGVDIASSDSSGPMPNQAERFESLARAGQVLISEPVCDAIRDHWRTLPGIVYHDWGRYYLKALGWWRVFEAVRNGYLPVSPSAQSPMQERRHAMSFLGRQKELADILDLFEKNRQAQDPASPDRRLITLHGPGGIGKTRLADEVEHHVAQAFDDGVYFIDFESLPSSQTCMESRIRDGCHIETDTVEKFFFDKNALLILDHCRATPDTAGFVEGLLNRCVRLRILATSDTPWGVPGEQAHRVGPLDETDAELLLLRYARLKNPRFAIGSANRPRVKALLDVTERIPYCLELAAARVRAGQSLQILAKGILRSRGVAQKALPRRPREVAGSKTGSHAKSQAACLAACLDWSCGLLAQAERDLLRKLTVFRGGFRAEDAAAICETEAAAALQSLNGWALLQRTGDRYFMPVAVRDYAIEKLGGAPTSLGRRHAEYYLSALQEARKAIDDPQRQQGLDRLLARISHKRIGKKPHFWHN